MSMFLELLAPVINSQRPTLNQLIFNVRQSYCARYSNRLDVCPSVCLSVSPSHAGIVSKRLNLSQNVFTVW